ncbi:Mitochondrial pyruvate carrier 1 [Smittium culicis]|uniref:Mitochondrial pyruvate carrier n=1 Tax=Smittium culicis TaxID=133412 RepID=A0A1R1XKH8_9FUNG|nr:Mitochondrial pyruvate carrier 1 [Smittium culicis]
MLVVNWGIPVAAVADTFKSPELISGRMTLALALYSSVFTRFAWVVTPRNYLLALMHLVNTGAQSTQMYRFVQYNGGLESTLKMAKDDLFGKKETTTDAGAVAGSEGAAATESQNQPPSAEKSS